MAHVQSLLMSVPCMHETVTHYGDVGYKTTCQLKSRFLFILVTLQYLQCFCLIDTLITEN